MDSRKVLIIGANGFFGSLLVEDLQRHVDCELVLAGRHSPVVADLRDPVSLERALDGVRVAICAAGPYQRLPLSLVELCLKHGVHYIDLADDRRFVLNVRSIAAAHPKTAIAVCTGWSTVPALSGLLSGIATAGMDAVDSIRIHMAPGNRGARQTATIASLLHSVGQPFDVIRKGSRRRVIGWSDPRTFVFPEPIGPRRGYLVDVPDLEIFPQLFKSGTVEFRAGSELQVWNRSLSMLSATRRSWAAWASAFQRVAALLSWMASDAGAIGVEVEGAVRRRATIIAESKGERIAVMPAAVMTALLLSDSVGLGVVSYRDWLTEDPLRLECEKRGFRLTVEDL
jgi:saccharopine dehydrogenase-like NADP-dependent oxidoreductase